ncbi:hypothetical protein B0T16DRAFT_402740 [Cercophora newfieldiana]|uniref:Uncharacterized protein n=1 Tax=Cercophora newfieldiana TaxID=92897 RepID=A0AA40D2K2_9PEZI|nr:hypothetical protein B0T16DRAFT_402740 [Cercophora newfieldiana]
MASHVRSLPSKLQHRHKTPQHHHTCTESGQRRRLHAKTPCRSRKYRPRLRRAIRRGRPQADFLRGCGPR